MATKNIKRKVRESEKNYWIVAMDKKLAMNNYRKGKDVIRKEMFYNSKGSALLFEAKAGCLKTRCYKARYGNEEDSCACCGKAKETMEHVLLECEEIKPGISLGTRHNKLLCFRDYQGNLNGPAIEDSKRRLQD